MGKKRFAKRILEWNTERSVSRLIFGWVCFYICRNY